MKKQLLLALFCGYTMLVNAQTPFMGCPGINLVIERTGNNSDVLNPVTISAIDPGTGIVSPSLGTVIDANTLANLQVNGLGLNAKDGFLYGLNADIPTSVTPNVPLPFYRIGNDAKAQQIGKIQTPPPFLSNLENISIINASAGEVDQNNNYYFTAATIIAPSLTSATVSRLFIGTLPAINTVPAGSPNTILVPSYTEIKAVDANAMAYINVLKTTATGVNVANVTDAGIKDLVYDQLSKNLLTYVTYLNPAPGATDYLGLMLKLDPATGNLTSIGMPTSLPFASATVDVSGTLLDKDGNFLILFTNGNIYRANTTMPGIFDGSITSLNSSTGLPTTLRGDLASCGAASSLLPIILNNFSVYGQNNTAIIKWETGSEINASRFIIERSLDGLSWSAIQTIASAGNSSTAKQYQYTDNNITAKTVFYRLKLVDIDGTAKYSVVKKVSFGTAGITISYYPNPVINTLYAESDAAFPDKLQVQISNAAGKTYATTFRKSSVNKISIDFSSFSPGIYFLQISNGTGNNSIQKIIKQ